MAGMQAMRRMAVALVMLVLLISIRPVWAQSGGGYDLTWNTVDGGGYTFSTGGDYTLGGTIGQPDASLLTGTGYSLGGGFWGSGPLAMEYRIYLPLVLRDYP